MCKHDAKNPTFSFEKVGCNDQSSTGFGTYYILNIPIQLNLIQTTPSSFFINRPALVSVTPSNEYLV